MIIVESHLAGGIWIHKDIAKIVVDIWRLAGLLKHLL